MIYPSHTTKVFMCRKPVDFRSGFDRLAYLSKSLGSQDPYSGKVFLFFNRDYTRAKIIYFDGSGCVLIWKRLEVGSFKPPLISEAGDFASINGTDLMLLLDGLPADSFRRPKKWRPSPTKLENA